MGALADRLNDPGVLRLENLDTDLRPPADAIESTRRAIDDDAAANSYLPFLGSEALRRAAADLVGGESAQRYAWDTECVITAGGLSGTLNVLLATPEPGDEVLMTDPSSVYIVPKRLQYYHVPDDVPANLVVINQISGLAVGRQVITGLIGQGRIRKQCGVTLRLNIKLGRAPRIHSSTSVRTRSISIWIRISVSAAL